MTTLLNLAPELINMIAVDYEHARPLTQVNQRLRDIVLTRVWEETVIDLGHPDFDSHLATIPIPIDALGRPVAIKRLRFVSKTDCWGGAETCLDRVTRVCAQLSKVKMFLWDIRSDLTDDTLSAFSIDAKIWITGRGGVTYVPDSLAWGVPSEDTNDIKSAAPLNSKISKVMLHMYKWGMPIEPLRLVGLEEMELNVPGSKGTSFLRHFFSEPIPALQTLRMSITNGDDTWSLREPIIFDEAGCLKRTTMPALRWVVMDFYGGNWWSDTWRYKLEVNVKEAFEESAGVKFTFTYY